MMQRRDPTVMAHRKALGAKLAAARKTKGLTQDRLSREIGINQNNIARLELGKTDLRLGLVADYLGVSVPAAAPAADGGRA